MAISVDIDRELYRQIRNDLLEQMNELHNNVLGVSQPRLLPKNFNDHVKFRRYIPYMGESQMNKKLLLLL